MKVHLPFSPSWIVLLGAVIAAFGAFLTSQKSSAQNARIAQLNETIAAYVTGADSYCEVEFSFHGGSPGVVDLELGHHGRYPVFDVEVSIRNATEELEILEQTRNGPRDLDRLKKLDATTTRIHVGTVAPPTITHKDEHITAYASRPLLLTRLQLPTSGDLVLQMEINERNGLVKQVIQFRKVGEQWTWARSTDTFLMRRQPSHAEEHHPHFPAGG